MSYRSKYDSKLPKEEKMSDHRERKEEKQRSSCNSEYMNYTNSDNPFGDSNLMKSFVWKKKLEKEGLDKLSSKEIKKRNRLAADKNRMELEKVKERRLIREKERECRDAELEKIQREKEAEQFKDWSKEEDQFHLNQVKLRSKIRILDGRAKPIDLLAAYIQIEDDKLLGDVTREPYTYLNGLKLEDLEDVREDIKVYMELDNEVNSSYWTDLTTIVDDEIRKLHDSADGRESINKSVSTEITAVFKGKTTKQLQAMYSQIESKLSNNAEGVDVSYWETLLSRLKSFMAKTRLSEMHKQMLYHKLHKLREEQGIQSSPLFPIAEKNKVSERAESSNDSNLELSKAGSTSTSLSMPADACTSGSPIPSTSYSNDFQTVDKQENNSFGIIAYDSGRYSPKLIKPEDLEPGIIITETEDDGKQLEFVQQHLKSGNSTEFAFGGEVDIRRENAYTFTDKYRPRKPRYFNRVHTGFEWNKYNQTHYDMDNPPPKIVQGYKFNIFYPDLMDKSKTPEYTLSPCDDKDFALLIFKAGPPYENIAFKIVNQEWEHSRKKGFRSQFQDGVLQLHFHFKRFRYRR